jgi:hypothetical protein
MTTPFDDPPTTPTAGPPPSVAPPGDDDPEHGMVWYKRTWVIVSAAILVVVGASVIIDLPRPVSNAEDVASQTTSLNEINTDLAPCSYAVGETFLIYHDDVNGVLTATDRDSASRMLVDDQTACSFTNQSVYDLTNDIEVQDTPAGKYVDRMLTVSTTWVTSDALAAVEDIQYLYLHPGNQAKERDLAAQEKLLAKDRSQAVFDIQQAELLLHAHLPGPNLPVLPSTTR